MKRALWSLALVSVLLPVGMASAQTAPTGAAVTAPAKAVPAPVTAAGACATTDLAKIFAAPVSEGNSTQTLSLTPKPLWKINCTIGECREPCVFDCQVDGCATNCTDLFTCECYCVC